MTSRGMHCGLTDVILDFKRLPMTALCLPGTLGLQHLFCQMSPGGEALHLVPLCPSIPTNPLPLGMLEDVHVGRKAMESGHKLMELEQN